jgi:hypothetical protein
MLTCIVKKLYMILPPIPVLCICNILSNPKIPNISMPGRLIGILDAYSRDRVMSSSVSMWRQLHAREPLTGLSLKIKDSR